ncbi:hypothetical protein [Streptomyces sp. NPDC087294]|uniref:hypothetical protein n=1 Tax=Streptomyces sp. NPDC087294 TaxID=3365777 RepID=UPI00381DFC7C
MSVETVVVALAADGRGWIDGTELRASEPTLDGARGAAYAEVARIARQRRSPIRVQATDPDGTMWRFVVDEGGGVHEPHRASQLTVDPDAAEVPAEYRAAAAVVVAVIGAAGDHLAVQQARRLEEEILARYGAGHPYALRALELRAHAVYECGLPSIACELYIEAADGWRHLGSTAYWGAAQRAYAMWCRIGDEPSAGMTWLGEKLVGIMELGGTQPKAVQVVLDRIDKLRLGA